MEKISHLRQRPSYLIHPPHSTLLTKKTTQTTLHQDVSKPLQKLSDLFLIVRSRTSDYIGSQTTEIFEALNYTIFEMMKSLTHFRFCQQ